MLFLEETSFEDCSEEKLHTIVKSIRTYTSFYGIDLCAGGILQEDFNKTGQLFLAYLMEKGRDPLWLGFAYGFKFPSLFSKDNLFYVDFINVFPDYRGKGFLNKIKNELKKMLGTKTIFRVLNDNKIILKHVHNRDLVNITKEYNCTFFRDK